MSKERTSGNTDDLFLIDLVDLLWRLLYQWKIIVVFAAIIGVWAMFAVYSWEKKDYDAEITRIEQQKDQKAYEAAKEKYSIEFGTDAAAILAELDETDRRAVINVLRLEDTLRKERDYYAESIYMNMDANHERRLECSFMITDLSDADAKYVSILTKEYLQYAESGLMVSELKQEIDPGAKDEIILQLVKVEEFREEYGTYEKNGADHFCINILLPDSVTDTEGIKKIVTDSITAYSDVLSRTVAGHKISLTHMKEFTTTDLDLLQKQNDWTIRMADVTTRVNNFKGGLQGKQLKAYQMITTGGATAVQSGTGEVWRELSGITEPSKNIKYGVIGAIIGVILYAGLYLIIIVLKGVCYSSYNIDKLAGSKVLGRIDLHEQATGIKRLFTSPFFDRIRKGGSVDIEKQAEKVVPEILAVCKYKGITKLTLIGDLGDDSAVVEELKRKLISYGIACEFFDYDNIQPDDYLEMKAAILFVRENQTKLKRIRKTREEMSSFNVENIGIIYIAS